MKNVEKIGIGFLQSFVANSSVLDPIFLTDDKNISWDGEIIVFEDKSRSKETYLGKVPVQIKCKEVINFSDTSITHSFQINDLKNYLKSGGVLLFVIEIKENLKKIYIKMLLPVDLKMILQKAKGKVTRVLNLNYLSDANTIEIENICQTFLLHQAKQISTINYSIPINECVEINIPIISDGTPISEYALNHELYAYGKGKFDKIEYFVDKVRITNIGSKLQKKIIINGRIYYNEFEIIKSKQEEILRIGKSISINLTKTQIEYSLAGSITEQVHDCEFLIDFVTNKTFSSGESNEFQYTVTEYVDEEKFLEQVKNIHQHLLDIYNLLVILKVNPDLLNINDGSISNLDNISSINLDFLIKTFVNHEKVTINPEKIGVYYLVVSNLTIGVFINKKTTEDYVRVYDLFESLDEIPFSVGPVNGEKSPISPYVLITRDNLLKLSNLNLDFALTDIKKNELNKNTFNYINQFGLELLKSFDLSKRNEFLDTALSLFLWMVNFSQNNIISQINKFQTFKRRRQLTEQEYQDLFILREQAKNDDRILCGINILLEHKAEAKFNFSRLSPEIQKEFREYPIYFLGNAINIFSEPEK